MPSTPPPRPRRPSGKDGDGRPARPSRPAKPRPPAAANDRRRATGGATGRGSGGGGSGRSGGSGRPTRDRTSSPPRSRKGGAPKAAGAAPKVDRPGWGSVARRGARQVVARPEDERARRQRPSGEPERSAPEPWEPDVWVEDVEPLRDKAASAVERGDRQPARQAASRRRRPPAPVAAEIGKAVGERRAAKVEQRLVEAARHFERGRAQDAYRIVRLLAEEAPQAPAIRELAGLCLYRLGRWKQAVNHLEAFVRLTGSVEQHPVLADCYRALGRHAKVQALWDELRQVSPSAELVTEARIVMAGSLADRGEVRKAIDVLERGPVAPRRSPAAHHLRLWYALADLYERVGETPRARELFARIAAVDPELADTAERLAALG